MSNTLFTFIADVTAASGPQQQPPDMSGTLIWFGAIMVVMWVLMIRPQQKKQKELAAKIAGLKTGDKVVTVGGIHGTISNVKDGSTLILKVDDNVKLTVDKSAVSLVLPKDIKEA